MAKDGSMRGGPRHGQGRPSKGVKEKLDAGNPGHRPIEVLDLPEPPELFGADIPDPREYMTEEQQSGIELHAAEIFEETWKWVASLGCEGLVSRQLIDQYSMSAARWIATEQAVSRYGYLSKHPTSGKPIASPFVAMSQNYMKQAQQIFYTMYQIIKENAAVEFEGNTPLDDTMEILLRTRKG